MEQVTDKLLVWGSDVEQGTLLQAAKTSRLPIVTGHVALMPDAHVGIGATVGSVIPTENAIIPAAVGVDIGCGMIAVETDANQDRLPDDLNQLMPLIELNVPAGVGKGHETSGREANAWLSGHPAPHLNRDQTGLTLRQYGTLGSGNHFLEVCLDERDVVWVVLHSGSRGIGNKLATGHINTARHLAKELELGLEDPDLAYFTQDQPEFQAYLADMLWAQDYALGNREQMMNAALTCLRELMPFRELDRINCHHNFTQREHHDGRELWITRKGAIQAGVGDRGVIPGSMGTRSYVVTGLGNPLSFNSCSHGAGRRMSRKRAREEFTADDLVKAMGDRAWNRDRAASLVDESPSSYKDIDQVMADQADLVRVEHTLHSVLNYKG